jgi:hypothetical protein
MADQIPDKKKLLPTDVFTPGSRPTLTYYDRPETNLEFKLLDALETKGFITSVSGPSKSGKTVLCESVIGKRKLLFISGGGVGTLEAFWERIRDRLNLPQQVMVVAGKTTTGTLETSAKAGVSIPGVFETGGGVKGTHGNTDSASTNTTHAPTQGLKLLSLLKELGFTLVVDDFHYVDSIIRMRLAEIFKDAARDGLSIVVVAVSHRADDAIRANPDLRGRVAVIDIPAWTETDLRKIAELGFPQLGINVKKTTIDRLVTESLGSPQLMQALCLKLCRQIGWNEGFSPEREVELTESSMGLLLKDTTELTDCRTAFEALATGPRIRGEDRKEFVFSDGKKGDVYLAILKAIAHEKPLLTISYDTLKERLDAICIGEKPRGSAVDRALEKMKEITDEKLNRDRVFDWNENHINLPDPYFLYYLRWAEWPNVN